MLGYTSFSKCSAIAQFKGPFGLVQTFFYALGSLDGKAQLIPFGDSRIMDCSRSHALSWHPRSTPREQLCFTPGVWQFVAVPRTGRGQSLGLAIYGGIASHNGRHLMLSNKLLNRGSLRLCRRIEAGNQRKSEHHFFPAARNSKEKNAPTHRRSPSFPPAPHPILAGNAAGRPLIGLPKPT